MSTIVKNLQFKDCLTKKYKVLRTRGERKYLNNFLNAISHFERTKIKMIVCLGLI